MARLRVALDKARGRPTPPAAVQLAQLPMPLLPSPLDARKSPAGKLRREPASRRKAALHLRRSIRAARLRVALDGERGRPDPEAVKGLAQLKLPPLE